MDLATLVKKVYTETNRPDLVDETLQAVLEATLSIHTYDNFYKDIREALVVFDNPLSFIQQIDVTSIPFYRNIAYIKKSSPALSSPEQFNTLLPSSFYCPPNQLILLTHKDIADIMDRYGYEFVDIWYQAGRNINIKSSTALQFAMVGWYAYPRVNVENDGVGYTSWVANEQPFAIIYKAAGQVFAKIGEDKSAMIYMKPPIPRAGLDSGGLFWQQLDTLVSNNLIPEA